MFKYEKKEILKQFKKSIEATSGEMGYGEPTAWHRGLWLSKEILEMILDEM